MNLERSLSPRLVLLALLCFMLPGTLRADDFTFSFTNTIGNVGGTVTGEILGLTNNSTGPATAVILESYPAALSVNPNLAAPPITVTTIPWNVARNQFAETILGRITDPSFDATVGSPYAAFQLYTFTDPVSGRGVRGAALTTCSDAATFIRPNLPPGNTQPPANQNCLFVQSENDGTSGVGRVTFAPIVSAVPEPGTADLMLLGIGLVFVMRKRIAQGLHQTT